MRAPPMMAGMACQGGGWAGGRVGGGQGWRGGGGRDGAGRWGAPRAPSGAEAGHDPPPPAVKHTLHKHTSTNNTNNTNTTNTNTDAHKEGPPPPQNPGAPRARASGFALEHMTIVVPAAVAMRAAVSLVAMPPVPHCVPPLLVSAVREAMSSTTWIGTAAGSVFFGGLRR